MVQKVCSNPDCRKVYQTETEIDDTMGYCSFECWEKVNCHEPETEVFESLKISYEE